MEMMFSEFYRELDRERQTRRIKFTWSLVTTNILSMDIWLAFIPVCLCSSDDVPSIELKHNSRIVKRQYFSDLYKEMCNKKELPGEVEMGRYHFKS